MADKEDCERTIQLLNRYGEAKFGDEWWPGNAVPWLGNARGRRLEMLLENIAPADIAETVDLLNRYGRTKFKDEWWPGNAQPWLDEEGAELESRLESPDFVYREPAPAP